RSELSAGCASCANFLDDELVAWVDLLKLQQDFMNVIRVGVFSGEYRSQDLKDVLNSLGVIDIGVADKLESVRLAKECQLKVPVKIRGLETVRGNKAGRWSVQCSGHLVEQVSVRAVLDLVSQFICNTRIET